MSEILKLKDDCVFVAVSDEGLILDTTKGVYYTVIPDEGIFLMSAIAAGVERENLRHAFMAKFSGVERVDNDYNTFIDELKKNGVLEPEAKEAGIQMMPGEAVSEYYNPPVVKARGVLSSSEWPALGIPTVRTRVIFIPGMIRVSIPGVRLAIWGPRPVIPSVRS